MLKIILLLFGDASSETKYIIHNKQENKKTWLKIFHHNVKYGYFSSLDEAKSCSKEGKFSMLSSISDSMKLNGNFELRLEYPLEGSVYHWKQTENPLSINENVQNSINYSQVIAPQDSYWRGYLAQSTKTRCTLLDGVTGGDWWFSVGTIQCPFEEDHYFTDHPNTIPGPTNVPVKELILWILVPNDYRFQHTQRFIIIVTILTLLL